MLCLMVFSWPSNPSSFFLDNDFSPYPFKMKPFHLFFPALFIVSVTADAQFPLTGNYNQDFNTLINTGSSAVLPQSWYMAESGTAADGLYTSGNGSSATGDTWSYGNTGDTDRALGSLRSGSLIPVFGFYFSNQTGQPVTSLSVSYTGEQWRLGAINRVDQLTVQYSLNATAITNGDWADIPELQFTAPVNTGATGILNGNSPANRTVIQYTITGIELLPGMNCFIRWTDPDASGADDGLAIDDFSLQPGYGLPAALFYRSVQSGNWSSLQSWESSADSITWTAAAILPDYHSSNVIIASGDTIYYNYNNTIDEVRIEPGAMLIYSGGQLILNDGPGNDLVTDSAGMFQLSLSAKPPLLNGTATVQLKGNGIMRVNAGGLTTVAGAGVHAAGYVYENGSVLENAYNGFGSAAVTYFPDVPDSVVPVLRIIQPVTLPVGSSSFTRVNGILEVISPVTFTGTGTKYFRNGIQGNSTLTTSATCGPVVIDGTVAILGGSGLIQLNNTVGMQTGSVTGTRLLLVHDKTIQGNVEFLPGTQRIETGDYNLRITGILNGGNENAFVSTNGSGQLILDQVSDNGKLFPVGHSRYNPVTVSNGGGGSWAVAVKDSVQPDYPLTADGAILLTWTINPLGQLPANGATIRFEFDDSTQTGILFNTPVHINDPVQLWYKRMGYWLANSVPVPVATVSSTRKSVTIPGLVQFGTLGVSRNGLPLPVYVSRFAVRPETAATCILEWAIENSALGGLNGFPEISVDGNNYNPVQYTLINTSAAYRAIVNPGTQLPHFYRMKIILPDGTVHYSTAARCMHIDTLCRNKIYPVPVNNIAYVQLNNFLSGIVYWKLFSLSGKQHQQGTGYIQQNQTYMQFDFTGLSAGVYLLQLQQDDRLTALPFVKQ